MLRKFSILSMVILACFAFSANAFARSNDVFEGSGKKTRINGWYDVYVSQANVWKKAGRLEFDEFYKDGRIDLSMYLKDSKGLKVRLVQQGGGAAHIDAVLLGEHPPISIKGSADTLALKKVSQKDFDVVDASRSDMVFSFAGERMSPNLMLTARVEPHKLNTTPFRFPLENLYWKVTDKSHFYTYKLDSQPGKLDIDGSLDSENLGKPFFKEYTRPGSGHPEDYTYGWVRNDDKHLYIALDIVPDNTMDGGKDYAKVYVKSDRGIKEFKISADSEIWGKPGFVYTDKAQFQHKVYEFKIPRSEIGLTDESDSGDIQLTFAAYGTLSAPPGIWYVDPLGTNSYPGYGDSPGSGAWETLHFAFGLINAHVDVGIYILNVAAGTYSKPNESDSILEILKDDVTIAGAGRGITIIEGSGATFWENGIVVSGSNVTIRDLTISDFSSDGIVINTGADNATIENCEISNNAAIGIALNSVNNVVETCAVHSNGDVGIYIPDISSNNKIRNNCEIYYNDYAGIKIYFSNDNEISNNTASIYDNGADGGYGIVLEYADNTIIHGNRIFWSQGGMYIQQTGIETWGGSGNQIYQNEIFGHSDLGGGAGIIVGDASPQIMRNEIYDNNAGIYIISSDADASPAIHNNLIYNTLYDPIAIFAYSVFSASPTIYHNTIDQSMSCMIYISGGPAAPMIKYNIFSNSDDAGICNDLGSPISDYNDFWNIFGASHSGLSPGAHDIFVDPLYASYSLQAGSPCIDVIPITEGDPVTDDFANTSRPQGEGFDMGAYEFTESDYTVTITISPEGGGRVVDDGGGIDCPGDCTGTYQAGTTPVFTATPEAGYSFQGWQGDITSADNPLTLTIDSNKQITAVFTANEGNSPADTPTAVSPVDGATITTTQVTLQASAFSDPENDDHYRTYWRVREAGSAFGRDDYDESFNAEATDGDLTSHSVSGLSTGLQYIWQAGYVDAGSGTTSWSEEFRFTVGTSSSDSSVSTQAGTTIEDYRMVSFVQWPDDPSGRETFGTPDSTQFRLLTYDPDFGSGGYREYGAGSSRQNGDDFKIEPGRSYWLLDKDGSNPTVEGVPVSTDSDIEVALSYNTASNNGYNMIACPNEADYLWDNVLVVVYDDDGNIVFGPEPVGNLDDPNEVIDKRLWRWEEGAYASDTAVVEAYSGYWVNVKIENVFLRFPENAQIPRGASVQAQTQPKTARSDTGDSPPMPPPALGASGGSSSGGGCFIDSARQTSIKK